MTIVKRRKRDTEKDRPFGLTGIVGMKVAIEEKAMRGWKEPEKETIDGYPGTERKNIKGKEIREVEA